MRIFHSNPSRYPWWTAGAIAKNGHFEFKLHVPKEILVKRLLDRQVALGNLKTRVASGTLSYALTQTSEVSRPGAKHSRNGVEY